MQSLYTSDTVRKQVGPKRADFHQNTMRTSLIAHLYVDKISISNEGRHFLEKKHRSLLQ